MTEIGELSFCELRSKEVVNGIDGRRLGRIVDIVFSADGGCVRGIIVPYNRRAVFFKSQDVFIPWECIKKIGEDVIIVELTGFLGKPSKKREPVMCAPPNKPEPPPPPPSCPNNAAKQNGESCAPDCDGRCEKCMLFDCEYRWNDFVKNSSDCGPGVYVDKNYGG